MQGPKREEALSLLQVKADLWHSKLNGILEARFVVVNCVRVERESHGNEKVAT